MRLSLIAIIVSSLFSHSMADGERVSFSCKADSGEGYLSCNLVNHSDEDILWLASPFALEGPLGADGYVYKFVGGERIENTLEYAPPLLQRLGGPIQFEPTVHLQEGDFDNIYRLQADASVSFRIRLGPREGAGQWLFRAKVVVARAQSLNDLAETGAITTECASRLKVGLDVRSAPAEIGVHEPSAGPRYGNDGCQDRVSEQFDHVFSNELLAGTTGATQ